MVEEHVVEWTRQWEQQGIEKGIEKGRQEGHQEGEAALLLRQLERKFGPLDEPTQQRIAAADSDTLLRWGERLLTANSLTEVFDNA